MAQRTLITLTDDIDGSGARETVVFGLDGATYEIDLHEAHAVQAAILGVLRDQAADPRLVVGPFNLGSAQNYRVPDGGLLRDGEGGLYVGTAALVVEVISPDDESYAKLDHYAQHGVTELIYINPEQHDVQLRRLTAGSYRLVERLSVVDLSLEQALTCL